MVISSDEGDVDDEMLTDGDELDEACVAQLRVLINEIIRKCGDKWCLYTKHKKNGKRRKLEHTTLERVLKNRNVPFTLITDKCNNHLICYII
jgi:hypothetical protein